MITPRFSLTQDADFVLLAIRLPNIRADEGEFYIDGHEVKFHLHPYFLRLTFCLLYTSPSPRDKRQSRMPSSA